MRHLELKFDKQLAQELNELKAAVKAKQKTLYKSRPDECVCNEDGLCAHHADVWNRLESTIKALDLAISSTFSR